MHWHDDIDWSGRYRLCRLGFAACAVGVALMVLDAATYLGLLFTGDPMIDQLMNSSYWKWGVGSTITWSTLLGPLILFGRWNEPTWRQRAGLLVALNLLDVGFWFLQHGHEFGLWPGELGHRWLRLHFLLASSWFQFALFAGLAGDLSKHLGSKQAGDGELRAKGLATAGALLWALIFLNHTAWHRGWPLRPRGFNNHLAFLMWTGLMLIRLVTAFQVSLLCVLACRECSQILRELDPSRRHLDALTSRSEAAGEENPWGPPHTDPWA